MKMDYIKREQKETKERTIPRAPDLGGTVGARGRERLDDSLKDPQLLKYTANRKYSGS